MPPDLEGERRAVAAETVQDPTGGGGVVPRRWRADDGIAHAHVQGPARQSVAGLCFRTWSMSVLLQFA